MVKLTISKVITPFDISIFTIIPAFKPLSAQADKGVGYLSPWGGRDNPKVKYKKRNVRK
jgi:hypothetical protein